MPEWLVFTVTTTVRVAEVPARLAPAAAVVARIRSAPGPGAFMVWLKRPLAFVVAVAIAFHFEPTARWSRTFTPDRNGLIEPVIVTFAPGFGRAGVTVRAMVVRTCVLSVSVGEVAVALPPLEERRTRSCWLPLPVAVRVML